MLVGLGLQEERPVCWGLSLLTGQGSFPGQMLVQMSGRRLTIFCLTEKRKKCLWWQWGRGIGGGGDSWGVSLWHQGFSRARACCGCRSCCGHSGWTGAAGWAGPLVPTPEQGPRGASQWYQVSVSGLCPSGVLLVSLGWEFRQPSSKGKVGSRLKHHSIGWILREGKVKWCLSRE